MFGTVTDQLDQQRFLSLSGTPYKARISEWCLLEIAPSQVTSKRIRPERPPRCSLEDLVGLQQGALGVDMGSQPGAERLEVASGKTGQDVRLCPTGSLKQLGRRQRAQGVGREVAPGSSRPVDVLQTSEPVIRNCQPQEGPDAFVEGGGEVVEGQAVREQRGLDVIADQDVRRVGDLVLELEPGDDAKVAAAAAQCQKRSGFSVALAVRKRPSAVTTSAESRLSQERPKWRVRWPKPPPRVRPPTPVVEMMPLGVASPKAWVA